MIAMDPNTILESVICQHHANHPSLFQVDTSQALGHTHSQIQYHSHRRWASVWTGIESSPPGAQRHPSLNNKPNRNIREADPPNI